MIEPPEGLDVDQREVSGWVGRFLSAAPSIFFAVGERIAMPTTNVDA